MIAAITFAAVLVGVCVACLAAGIWCLFASGETGNCDLDDAVSCQRDWRLL